MALANTTKYLAAVNVLNSFSNKNYVIVLFLAGDSMAYHNGRAFSTKDRDV